MRLWPDDICLGIWEECWTEYMADRIDSMLPHGGRVLEIGCADADWMTAMLARRPDLDLTGIDVREAERPGRVLRQDLFDVSFEDASFDAIVAVSSIEHVGLGSYGDRRVENGDVAAIGLCHGWVKPGGWMYLDVPFVTGGPMWSDSNARHYDHAGWEALTAGWAPVWDKVVSRVHPDSPYRAAVLLR